MYILDLLDSMPQLRLSRAVMKSILWALKEFDVPNVPSFRQLRSAQKALAQKINISPSRHESAMGNIFYQNSPKALLALVRRLIFCDWNHIKPHHTQDWGNPLVRERMTVYPEVTSTIAESWQAGKWVNEVTPDELTPMWADWQRSPDYHFYVNEVARTRDGRYLVPSRWIIYNGEEYADGQLASVDDRVRQGTGCQLCVTGGKGQLTEPVHCK